MEAQLKFVATKREILYISVSRPGHVTKIHRSSVARSGVTGKHVPLFQQFCRVHLMK